jgi:hypothetical protein
VPGRAKRTCRDERDRQKTHLKMTVVNASFDYRNVILLTRELQPPTARARRPPDPAGTR